MDNKPGANSIIGAAEAARAAPDGYTLFMPNGTTMTANQFMYSKLPYDPCATSPHQRHRGHSADRDGQRDCASQTLSELIELRRRTPIR